ncbi:MAG: nitroreductase [Oricola sp.]
MQVQCAIPMATNHANSSNFMTMNRSVIDYLKTRRSVPLTMIHGPGPDAGQLREMLEIAARSPDHGRLEPWRFVIYREQAGREIGEKLAARAQEINGPMPDDQIERERNRLLRAPVAVGVVSVTREHEKIPAWEQFLSAGAVAMNLVHAANAFGFCANWVTGWYSDDAKGRAILGLAPQERMAGIVHIGSCDRDIADRPRPDVDTLTSEYAGEYEG